MRRYGKVVLRRRNEVWRLGHRSNHSQLSDLIRQLTRLNCPINFGHKLAIRNRARGFKPFSNRGMMKEGCCARILNPFPISFFSLSRPFSRNLSFLYATSPVRRLDGREGCNRGEGKVGVARKTRGRTRVRHWHFANPSLSVGLFFSALSFLKCYFQVRQVGERRGWDGSILYLSRSFAHSFSSTL